MSNIHNRKTIAWWEKVLRFSGTCQWSSRRLLYSQYVAYFWNASYFAFSPLPLVIILRCRYLHPWDVVELSPQKARLIFESLGAHTRPNLHPHDLIANRVPGNTRQSHRYVFLSSCITSPIVAAGLRGEQIMLIVGGAARSFFPQPYPSPPLRKPRRESYYRNHGFGKVEEDAAVGANWYVNFVLISIVRSELWRRLGPLESWDRTAVMHPTANILAGYVPDYFYDNELRANKSNGGLPREDAGA